ncbi:carbohydrate ABC transporter permease [Paenibacillus arenilitoris]|uniref:Carbohydrate ABC transporter permease n=1 Tax=Paenibacillus arenilitoris TaxID=2772299 RepID=A0A927CMP0_9BACL|nr:carbohydrate ABC transporter permease [Paenibacillus arenilitoris]MBD2870839.1 carbohydrate ABC transporter permease [Paenibacillus arenilitoris]
MRRLSYAFLALISVVSLLPFYLMMTMSTYYTEDLFKGLPLWPSDFLRENLATVFRSNFAQVYLNSLTVSVAAVASCLLISAMIGYAIAKFRFRLRSALHFFMMITMMVPTQVGLIGYVIEMKALGMGNTLLPVILIWTAFPFGAFFMTQFIKDTVSQELLESARLDGCSEPGIFFRVVLPLVKPGLSTLAMLVFLWSWNSYLLPLVVINNQKWYTLPLFISNLGIVHRTDYAAMMTALCMAVVPLLVIFILASKTFIKGITAGSVKG